MKHKTNESEYHEGDGELNQYLTRDFFFIIIGSNNYNNYIETYTTKKAVNEVRIYASQSTYYYIQQNLHYATYREKKT